MNIFFQPDNTKKFLEGDEAQHCIRALRMHPGDFLLVTDGQGRKARARLTDVSKKECFYEIESLEIVPPPPYTIEMAVCPTRKADRNEWMVEKMCEMGVKQINFLVSEHTHQETIKRVVNLERLQRIALSAMKQSRQFYLPKLNFFLSIEDFFKQNLAKHRYIAYVSEKEENKHLIEVAASTESVAVLIGPEGDFSPSEIVKAIECGFTPVSLGETRLRTETAAVLACHSVHLANVMQN
ncbi:RsmE family RNA methyltransferase [Persicitalea jodogahamensis]|uniref:Ribosomal RNA small subunit methyltransferase E n=1 Tax=Persicitalea jodogahamensis TaxID=402147 RepID=A0A8J3GBI2_9BACT|nr:RsmE family RNA methyltransferase [Persicitalea jodogahamensis]GHB81917.1 ribosomal RNA small subunit methyltransferase E [Persicitalea jodogahamensis]